MSNVPKKNSSNLTINEKEYYINLEKIKAFKEQIFNKERSKNKQNSINGKNDKKSRHKTRSKLRRKALTKGKFKLSPIDRLSIGAKKSLLTLKLESEKLNYLLNREKKKLPPISDSVYKRLINQNTNSILLPKIDEINKDCCINRSNSLNNSLNNYMKSNRSNDSKNINNSSTHGHDKKISDSRINSNKKTDTQLDINKYITDKNSSKHKENETVNLNSNNISILKLTSNNINNNILNKSYDNNNYLNNNKLCKSFESNNNDKTNNNMKISTIINKDAIKNVSKSLNILLNDKNNNDNSANEIKKENNNSNNNAKDKINSNHDNKINNLCKKEQTKEKEEKIINKITNNNNINNSGNVNIDINNIKSSNNVINNINNNSNRNIKNLSKKEENKAKEEISKSVSPPHKSNKNDINLNKYETNNPMSTKSKKKNESLFLEYIAYPGNNPKLINAVMKKRSSTWKKGDKKYPQFCTLLWTATVQEIDYVLAASYHQYVNHFEYNGEIANKMRLFGNLIRACDVSKKKLNLFSFYPLTIIFPLNDNMSDCYRQQLTSFEYLYSNIESFICGNVTINKNYNDLFKSVVYSKKIGQNQQIQIPQTHYENKNLWLIKPINMNRGRFIKVESDLNKIEEELTKLKSLHAIKNKKNETVIDAEYIILQKYIEKPLLYKQRKFDIRIWVLIISEHPNDVYIFKEGHLKATCDNFTLDTNDKYIHLTNYSVQKHHSNFSKVEKGNEISFKMFQDELDNQGINIIFRETIYKKICKIIRFTVGVAKERINILSRKRCFEIFGYDFLIDANLDPFLIEINTNPGLEISSPLIQQLVPRMIDDAFKLTIDEDFQLNIDENNEDCKKVFHVDGHDDSENMWEKFSIINY